MALKINNALLLGGSGSIGISLTPFLKNDFNNFLSIDINQNELNLKNNEFIQHDLKNGLPLSAIKFIEENATDGIALINCLGKISSNSFLSLNTNRNNHKSQFSDQIKLLSNDFESNFLLPITLSSQIANLIIGERGLGSIINFSSVSSYGNPGQLGYSAMKGAIEIGTKVLARELGSLGIRCNTIAPGFIETDSMRSNMTPQSIQKIINKTTLKRLGSIQNLYQAIYMLINCDYINGQVIRIDGDLRI